MLQNENNILALDERTMSIIKTLRAYRAKFQELHETLDKQVFKRLEPIILYGKAFQSITEKLSQKMNISPKNSLWSKDILRKILMPNLPLEKLDLNYTNRFMSPLVSNHDFKKTNDTRVKYELPINITIYNDDNSKHVDTTSEVVRHVLNVLEDNNEKLIKKLY